MTQLVQINPARLKHQQKLFDMSESDLLEYLNAKRKNKLVKDDIFGKEIKKSHLKQINQLFKKRLSYYTNPVNPKVSKNTSIFFRNTSFNSKLNLADRQYIRHVEDEILYINSMIYLSNFGKLSRPSEFNNISIKDPTADVSKIVRGSLPSTRKIKDDKEFLKDLIQQLATINVFVLEIVEHPQKKLKMNLEGAFIAPHWIAIKRNQRAFKREIFTLCHELGHYLLNIEDIDDDTTGFIGKNQKGNIEKWCNNFAFDFLFNDDWSHLVKRYRKDKSIDNIEVIEMSNNYHISRLAIFTQLYYRKEITRDEYKYLRNSLRLRYETLEDERKKEAEQEKLQTSKGKRGFGMAKPIRSPLVEDVFRHAYFKDAADEIDIMKYFKLKHSSKVDELLYGESL